ncbi:hypothetical protein [Ligilactobacillus ceti]|uniref:Uncharacterized protein n=1 Tax=Ligilactobacillus ceti DSM 22408 TaxID=1122146 RepID=A0A0R2KR51_9LACO|nr:hypothetical protein [Ligilactobacillus ceti]KRN89372.1 hypothetical protein IV53_GL000090 [Ligilactobacillus ceti DSM 22408]
MLSNMVQMIVCWALASYTFYYSRKRKQEGKIGAKWYLGVTILLVLGGIEAWIF